MAIAETAVPHLGLDGLRRHLREIAETVTEPYLDEIDQLTSEYEQIIGDFRAWEENAEGLWSAIAEKLEEEEPDLSEFEKPKARPANEPDGFVLFDSKRDYLSQMDAYRKWQRR